MSLMRTKAINADHHLVDTGLKRCLTATDLTLLGIGAIIGAGIFVLTGVAAATKAGPAIALSFVVAGFACAFSALAYAELASTVGGCGSAYGYAYAGLGEIVAWIIGWDLVLEYGFATPTVAIGWSGYVGNALTAIGWELPSTLLNAPGTPHIEGAIMNLPAFLIIMVLSVLLAIGVSTSARFNHAMVFVKLTAITVFIAVAAFNVTPSNWTPFMPFGWEGVMAGGALIFFAYIGFDAVSTAADETINPQRDLPIGILASLVICTVIYIVVSLLLTGLVPYTELNNSSPVSSALLKVGHNFAAGLISAGAIAGLTTVMLVLYYGLTRIFLAMARDGLLPPIFSKVNSKTQTPIPVILISGIFMALVAGFTPINEVAELVNIGTLAAFTLVCVGVIVLRRTHPDLPRPFKTPLSPLFPILGIVFCLYLMFQLPMVTWLRFGIWLIIGLGIYFMYSRGNSELNKVTA